MTNADMSQYLDVFLDEGREQLALLEANVLEMERGDHTLEMLQTLFRAAHTLKGSSRAMGFLAIGDLTHEMESLLDALRLDQLQVTTPIVNALLDCLDALAALVDSVALSGTDATGKDIPALVARLNALGTAPDLDPPSSPNPGGAGEELGEERPFPLAEHEQAGVDAARDAGLGVYQITVTLSPECLMKSVRTWMVLAALEPLGAVLAADPNEDALEAEQFDSSFRLLLAAETPPAQIEAALSAISEIESVQVQPWGRQDAPRAAPSPAPDLPAPAPPIAADKAVADKAVADKPVADKPVADKAAVAQSHTIRVEVSRLDSLLNLVGELVIERAQIQRIGTDLHRRYPRDEEAVQLGETTHRLARVTSELQDQIMKARMLPIDGVFQRLPRMVRDLAQKTGKELRFEMSGGETELDRTVLEVLSDPLIHLLRNSVDHGIEPPDARAAAGKPAEGKVTLAARHEENHIVIEIEDDGRGMDPHRLKQSAIQKGLLTEAAAGAMGDRDALGLIFASGFSTAAVLSDISGRGVGMDIVRSNLEKVGGRILIDSELGRGSRFTIHLPLTLAIVRAVLVQSGGGTYVLPMGSVVEMLRLGTGDGGTLRRTLGGQAIISLRGRTIPLANLSDLLCGSPDATRPEQIADEAYVVVAGAGNRQIGLCVDALVGEQEVVIKSLGTMLGDIPGLSGATILGDGRVALIVDVAKAVAQASLAPASAALAAAAPTSSGRMEMERPLALA